MKILIGDIELSHAVYMAYPAKKPQFLRREQMIHPQYMFSFAYKWHHEKKIKAVSLLDDKARFKANFRDDEYLVRETHKLLMEADVFVGHNSDGFDLKHINYRAHLLGLPPVEIAKVDTLKVARRCFQAPSNSMDNLLKDMGHVGKQGKPNQYEWMDAAQGCKKALKKIVTYNKYDVEGQIFLYEKLLPWIHNHPNHNLFIRDEDGNEIGVCKNCGSPELIQSKKRKLSSGTMRVQYQCSDCNSYTTFGASVRRAKFA